MEKISIIGIVGSLRKNSLNRHLLAAAAEVAPPEISITTAAIADFPLYNEDLEVAYPAAVSRVKNMIKVADGVLIATPEYNRSVPGPLKNAVDWLSRPDGESAWKQKPVAILGAAPGALGTALAQFSLKQSMLHLNAALLAQPEFYVSGKDKFDAAGKLIDEKTREKLGKFMLAFKALIQSRRTS